MRTSGGERRPTRGTRGGVTRPTRSWARNWCVVVPTLVTALVGSASLARSSIWTDEAATWATARMPLSSIFDFTAHTRDAVFLPYYVLMHAWLLLGQQLWWIRLPSLLAAIATTWTLTSLVRRWFEPPWALLAGILLALNPLFVRWAVEARPYALATLFAALSTLALWGAVERGGRRRWLAYGAFSVLMLLFHLLGILVLGAHAVALVVGKRKSAWLGGAVTIAASVIVVAPLAVVAARQSAQVAWIPRPTLATFFTSLTDASGGHAAAFGLLAAVVAVLLAARRSPAGSTERFRVALVLAWALLPPVTLVAVSFVHPLYVDRYALVSVPAVAAVEAAAAEYLWRLVRAHTGVGARRPGSPAGVHPGPVRDSAFRARSARPGLTALAAVVIVLAPAWLAHEAWRVARATYYVDDYRSAAATLHHDLATTDADVLVVNAESGQGFAFYASSTRWRDELLDPSPVSLTRIVYRRPFREAVLGRPGMIWSRSQTAPRTCPTVVVIGWHPMSDPRFDIGDRACRLRGVRYFGLVWVARGGAA